MSQGLTPVPGRLTTSILSSQGRTRRDVASGCHAASRYFADLAFGIGQVQLSSPQDDLGLSGQTDVFGQFRRRQAEGVVGSRLIAVEGKVLFKHTGAGRNSQLARRRVLRVIAIADGAAIPV